MSLSFPRIRISFADVSGAAREDASFVTIAPVPRIQPLEEILAQIFVQVSGAA